MTRRRPWSPAAAAALGLAVGACTSTSDVSRVAPTASPTTAPATSAAPISDTPLGSDVVVIPRADGEWTTDPNACPEPELADTPLPATVRVGLIVAGGGPTLPEESPVAVGLRLALDDANERAAVPGHTFALTVIGASDETVGVAGALNTLIAKGMHVLAAIARPTGELQSAEIASAMCVPVIGDLGESAALGDLSLTAWVTGLRVPAGTEGAIAATGLASLDEFGDGVTGQPARPVTVLADDGDHGRAFSDGARTVLAVRQIASTTPTLIDGGDLRAGVRSIRSAAKGEPPAVVIDVPAYQCPAMLRELAAMRSSGTGWNPVVVVSSRCGQRAVLGLGGRAADGVYTVASFVDVADPDRDGAAKEIGQLLDLAGLRGERSVAVLGWSSGEALVEAMREALSFGPLTRRGVIEAARQMGYLPKLAYAGVESRTAGVADAFPFESMQFLRWSEQRFEAIGPVISEFERQG